jgi:hypothetical protein
VHAKTAGLTAIEVYPGHDGQAYEQISDFILNEKNELYLCGAASVIDKNEYHKLVKVVLATGMSLERDPKGVLILTQASGPACVVPGNLKFDKAESLTPAQLADKAEIVGTVSPASDPAATQIAPLKPGVKLVFVAAPDQELAEFLRADRQGNIPGWQAYFKKYPAGAHVAGARKALATLDLDVANTDRQAYENSKSGGVPDYSKLAQAHQMADQAQSLTPSDAAVTDLESKIHAEVLALSHAAIDKLKLYKEALNQRTAGYANLVAAENLANGASSVEPAAPEAASAESQTMAARASFNKVLRDTEAKTAARQADGAAQAIDSLRSFAQENRTIADDLNAIAGLYLADAKQLEEQPDWPGAVTDLEKASATVSSPETTALLDEARKQAKNAADKAAALAVTQKSQDAESRGDIIAAYEVLDNLPPDQHALVTARLDTLKDQYVQAAEQAATALQKAHEPINGISDEIGIQTAYGYVQRCFGLTNDPTLQDRLTILGDDLSGYYLQQGKKYAEKPDGSGVNVGWEYLDEARPYKSKTYLGQINDEMASVQSSHNLKSRLSLKVGFRDQTSRRESVQFATQLTDALATGLEAKASGPRVLVIVAQDATKVPPVFELVGDVVQHERTTTPEQIAVESKFLAGEQQIPNPDWIKLNEKYSAADNELKSAQSVLQGAVTRGKKSEIKDATQAVANAEKKVQDLQAKMDATAKEIAQDIERPYTYTKVVYHLRTTVELQFRILDSSETEIVQRVPVKVETPNEYTILQNVNPQDTQGVRSQGMVQNDNDFFEAGENKARDDLIQKAIAQVDGLPEVVLAQADHKAAEGNNDGAAELYILYLHITPPAATPERNKANAFLATQFNFKDIGRDVSPQ